jgi:hypothetical protein
MSKELSKTFNEYLLGISDFDMLLKQKTQGLVSLGFNSNMLLWKTVKSILAHSVIIHNEECYYV